MVLEAANVSKKFARSLKRSIAYALRDVVSEVCGGRRNTDRLRTGEFWAVRNVSFQLNKGEALGLIGPNGSGKSTLLRLISGLIKPDTGMLRLRGRVAPLIALGAGFSPVLTGRENIFVNMAILGLNHREISKEFDNVLKFAEIGDAIDAPVQSYSSGMAARLGFACAIHTRPDILLIDEVLSVGDVRFRAKCYRRLAALKQAGTSFVLVSHSSSAILSVCDSVLYLSGGQQKLHGNPVKVMSCYEQDLLVAPGEETTGSLVLPNKAAAASTGLDIVAVYLRDSAGQKIANLRSGVGARICVEAKAHKAFLSVGLWLILRQANGELEPVLTLNSERDAATFNLEPGSNEFECHLPVCGLRPGIYTAKISLIQGSIYVLDAVESFRFEVRSGQDLADSLYFQPRVWSVNGREPGRYGEAQV